MQLSLLWRQCCRQFRWERGRRCWGKRWWRSWRKRSRREWRGGGLRAERLLEVGVIISPAEAPVATIDSGGRFLCEQAASPRLRRAGGAGSNSAMFSLRAPHQPVGSYFSGGALVRAALLGSQSSRSLFRARTRRVVLRPIGGGLQTAHRCCVANGPSTYLTLSAIYLTLSTIDSSSSYARGVGPTRHRGTAL
jgi:hypothetical protein